MSRTSKAALDILEISKPDKVVTLGGECSVSVPVFTWLNAKLEGDVAVIWMDAHPDVILAGLREYVYPYIKEKVKELGLTHFSPEILSTDSKSYWIGFEATGKRK